MKKLALLIPAVFLLGCSTSAGVAVATMGIAGAALTTYCLTGGAGCSPAVIAYAALITKEAVKDAAVLESGSSTLADLQQVVANLQQDIANGNALAGLSSGQSIEVAAVVAAVNTVLTITETIISKTPAPAPTSPASITVKLPTLSSHDKSEIAKMRMKIGSGVK